MRPRDGIVGVVLAGGRAVRMGGEKAGAELDGRPLLAYPLAALQACGFHALAVVAKRDTALPPLGAGVERWDEPDEPHHPAVGIAAALGRAGGRAVFACAADMVLLDAATVALVCDAAAPGDRVVCARAAGRLQPLCALWLPGSADALAAAGAGALTRLVESLDPRVVELPDEDAVFNVNTPGDLARARALLSGG